MNTPDVKKAASGCYAAPPGTGPHGETCGTCAHHVVQRVSRVCHKHKCGLMRACWTHSERTDIRVRSPACAKWKKEE